MICSILTSTCNAVQVNGKLGRFTFIDACLSQHASSYFNMRSLSDEDSIEWRCQWHAQSYRWQFMAYEINPWVPSFHKQISTNWLSQCLQESWPSKRQLRGGSFLLQHFGKKYGTLSILPANHSNEILNFSLWKGNRGKPNKLGNKYLDKYTFSKEVPTLIF